MNEDKGAEILRDHERLVADRMNLDSHCEEVAERILPRMKGMFGSRSYNRQTKGEKNTELMFDATASIALDRFAAVMDSMLTPRTTKWHRLRATDPALNKDPLVIRWFDEARDILFKHRYAPKANFASQNHEGFVSLGAFGTSCLFVDRRDPGPGDVIGGLRYQAVPLSEMYLRTNHQGVTDTVHRVRWLTARQAFAIFEPKFLPEQIVRAVNGEGGNPDQEFEFVHCVKPRADYDPQRLDRAGKPWASYIVCKQNKMIQVRRGEDDGEGGYDTFPFAVGRYVTSPGEVYGRSPAMLVLPNIKVLNEQKKTQLKIGHRLADPVILAHDDGVLDTFSLKPGAVNFGGVDSQGRKLVQALDMPAGQLQALDKVMEMERAPINDAFLVSLFQILVETPQMTATEVLERTREKGILLAPTMGRQQSEYLGPLIERELSVLMAQGLLPPMPPVLVEANGEYDIEYESPLSRAQRSEEAAGFMRTLEMAGQYANLTRDPAPLDWFNFDKAMPAIADIQAVPAMWMRTLDEVNAVREGRNQAAQVKQMTDAAPGAAAMIKAIGSTQQQTRPA